MAEAYPLVATTGYADIDTKLSQLPPALQRKFYRGALRKGGNRVKQEFQRIVKDEAYDTGAYMRATSVRALKRKKDRIGVSLHVDKSKLIARRQKKTGETKEYYYPASLEFGYTRKNGTHVKPVRAQRRALYDNQKVYLAYFVGDMRQFLAEQKVTTRLPKATGFGKL